MISGLKFKCQPYTKCDTERLDYSVWYVGAETLTGTVAWQRNLYAKHPAAPTVSSAKQTFVSVNYSQ